MLKTRVIPCLLLKDGGLVKTIQFKDPKYIGDPVNTVKIFNEKEIDELIILDISATIEGREPSFDIISRIASECFMPLGYGGGIKNIKDIEKIFNIGVEKVVINNYAIKNSLFIKEASYNFGSQSIVVSIDVKKDATGKHRIFSYDKTSIKYDLIEFVAKMEEMGAGELFLNSVDNDGLMQGYDIDLIEKVSKAVRIPVIACGGAEKIEDFSKAVNAGASAVSAGSMFVFYGKLKAVLINFPSQKELRAILN